MIGLRRLSVTLSALLLVELASTGAVFGRSPTPGSQSWSTSNIDAHASTFHWDSSVPTWMKAPMEDVLEVGWADSTANNSHSIRFQYSSGGSATVLFKSVSGIDDCDAVNWIGCEAGAGTWTWKIWLRNGGGYVFCQNNPGSDPCRDVERVGIHEAGHAGGFLNHNTDTSQSNTVMQAAAPPFVDDSGSETHTLRRCDEARMQLLYDVLSAGGPYADCFGSIPGHGPTGLYAVASPGSADPTCVAYGQAIDTAGYIRVRIDDNYDRLSGNYLFGRPVYFDRALAGSGNWTVDYASTTATSAVNGHNWFKSFVVTGSNGSVSYDFRAHFKGEAGLDADYSSTFTLTWSTAC